MSDIPINILLKMKADIDQAVKHVNDGLGGLGKTAKQSEKSLNDMIKSPIAPLRTFIRAIRMYSFVFSASMGVMIKSVLDFDKTSNELNKTAISLGISTEELSKKIYGYNIVTEQATTGTGMIKNMLGEVKKLWDKIGSSTAAAVNNVVLYQKHVDAYWKKVGQIQKGMTSKELSGFANEPTVLGGYNERVWNEVGKGLQAQLTTETEARLATSIEAFNIQADLNNKIKVLRNNDVGVLKDFLDAQRKEYSKFGQDVLKTFDEFYALQMDKQISAYYGIKTFSQNMQDSVKSAVAGMTGVLNSFFSDTFSGQLKKAKDYFAEFGKSLLNMFSKMISEMIARWILFGTAMGGGNGAGGIGKWAGIISSIGSLFPGGGGGIGKIQPATSIGNIGRGSLFPPIQLHSGGLIKAHSGLAMDEVPIIAQSGERILSRAQNRRYEQGSQSPVVVMIQAWDTQDIMRNRKSIEGIIINALKSNSGVRGAVKNYA